MIGDSIGCVACVDMTTSAISVRYPSESVIKIILAPLDLHSLMLVSIKDRVLSVGAIAITGVHLQSVLLAVLSSPPG